MAPSSPMPPTMAEREAELAALQTAFDEYISSSRELEEELDAELEKMQEKLAESSAANATLASQLESITPQLSSLEKALAMARSDLEKERNLRRQAELTQDEAEARAREAEGSLASLREDYDHTIEELAFRETEIEELRLGLEVERERHREEVEELRADLEVARASRGGGENERNGSAGDDAIRDEAASAASADAGGGALPRHSVENGDSGCHDGNIEVAAGDENGDKWVGSASVDVDGASGGDETNEYVKRLEDELEVVTEQLIEAERRLAETEDKLAASERHGKETESKLVELQEQIKELELQKQIRDAEPANDEITASEKKEQENRAESSAMNDRSLEKDIVIQLREEHHIKTEEEQRLREELELTAEELALTQEELRAVEEDSKQKSADLEKAITAHRHEVAALKAELERAASDAGCASKQIEALEEALQKETAQVSALQEEVSNLNVALQNANNDRSAVLEELDALRERFDEAQKEAETTGRDEALEELRSELLEAHSREVEELKEELQGLKDTNDHLKQMVEEAEMAVAVARGENRGHRTEEEPDEEVKMQASVALLRDKLAQAEEDLAQQAREATELRSELERKESQRKRELAKAEEDLSNLKRQLAKNRAKAASKGVAAVSSGATMSSKGSSVESMLLDDLSTLDWAEEERDELSSSEFGRSHARSRRLEPHIRRRRGRSSSPTTLQRLEGDKAVHIARAKKLQQECRSLKDQQRMGEVRVKRLEDEVKGLQRRLLGSGGDSPVFSQVSGFSPAVTVVQENALVTQDMDDKGVENILNSRDPKRIAEELRMLAKKSAMQRDYNAQLLGKILRLQGNIQVCCRVRPMKVSEMQQGLKGVVEPLSETEVGCFDSRTKAWKSYAFDKVWGPDHTQQGVFQDVEPLALSVVDGYNACIFAYGQTGSGKTYTMEGIGNQYGISHRTIQRIFGLLQYRAQKRAAELRLRAEVTGEDNERDLTNESTEARDDSESEPFVFSLKVGMLEIYNDEVYDLLSPLPSDSALCLDRKPSLDIRRSKENRIEVPGLTKEKVNCIQDVMNLLKRGNENRATAATNLNEHSSRSHMVLHVEVTSGIEGQPQSSGHLFLVDLAGSERVRKSAVEGKELKEAGYINKSLSALGNVMEALDRKASHIPYRDSKLTYLLQDSLGGNSKTMMVVNVCPTSDSFDETQYALQFATRVRRIHLGTAQRNVSAKNLEETVKILTSELKLLTKSKERTEEQLRSLRRDHERIKERLAASSESRVRNSDETRTMAVLRRSNTDMTTRWQKEKTLREEKAAELENSQKELRRVQQQLLKATRECDNLTRKLEEKEEALEKLTKEFRTAKDASVAANLRARRVQLIQARRSSTAPRSPESVRSSKLRMPTKTKVSSGTDENEETAPTSTSANDQEGEMGDSGEVREKVISLLKEHDPKKVDKVDDILDKFKGKESTLLEKLHKRYDSDTRSISSLRSDTASLKSNKSIVSPASRQGGKSRSEMALARHKERMRSRRSVPGDGT